jgi:hypothetical protein
MKRGGAVGWVVTAVAMLAVAVGASLPAEASTSPKFSSPSVGRQGASTRAPVAKGTPRATAAAPVSLGPISFGRILVDPATSHIFISAPNESSIVVLDYSGTILKTITGEAGASGMAIRGNTLYVALNTAGAIDKIDTGTLRETGQLVSGLLRPRDLVLAGSKLWTTTGNCAQWAVQLVSIDPAAASPTAVLYPTAFNSNNGLSYCAAFASNPNDNPNLLLAWDLGLSPADITSFNVSTGSPVQQASAREVTLGNLQDIAVNPDGIHFITASGAPYEFDEWNASNLAQDGIVYPANAYPTAVATTPGNGAVMGGGLNGEYAPDFYAYRIGKPAAPLNSVDFGGPNDAFNTVPDRGVAFKPDGTSAFVVSAGSYGSGLLLNIVPVPVAGAPTPPTGVAANTGIQAATVSWGAPVDQGSGPVTNYTVTSAPGGLTATTSQTSTTVIGLSPGVSYTFTVTATNAAGTSFPSSPSNAVTPWACGPPTNVSGTPGNGSVSLTWQAPAKPGASFITAYRVTPYVGTTAYGPTTVSGSPAPTSATVTGLTNGTSYTFIVACEIHGAPGQDSAPSNPIAPGAPPGAPSPPTNVWATPDPGIASATVTWNAPVNPGNSPVTSYTVTSSPGGVTVTVPATQTSAVVNGLTPGLTYTFTVTATNANGTSLPSAPSGQMAPWACGPPTNVQAVPGDSSAFVSWQPPANPGASAVTAYGIAARVGDVSYGGQTFVYGAPGSPTPTSAIVSPLTNGTTYTIIVFCMINSARGPDSAPSNAITPIQGGNYHPLIPARILDTRNGFPGPLQYRETRSVQIRGQGLVPPSGVSAVVLNVTVTGPTSAGYLTVWPAGAPQPTASNLNFVAGQTVPNLVEVAVGAGGNVNIAAGFAGGAGSHVDVIFDVAGWVGEATNSMVKDGLYQPLTPARIMDTRSGTGVRQGSVGPGGMVALNVFGPGGVPAGSGVSAVVLNVTVTNPTLPGYVTVFPTGGQRPTASNLNFTAGQTVPNRVIVKVGTGGKVSFFNAAGTVHVIVDIGGWFTDATSTVGGARFTGVLPTRMIDTRDPAIGPLIGGQPVHFQLTDQNRNPVTGVSALVINVTATNATAASYVTLWPDGPPQPSVSDLNFAAGQTVPNLVVVKLGNNATVDISNAAGQTDLIIDLVGFYGDAVAAPAGPMRSFSFKLNPLSQH